MSSGLPTMVFLFRLYQPVQVPGLSQYLPASSDRLFPCATVTSVSAAVSTTFTEGGRTGKEPESGPVTITVCAMAGAALITLAIAPAPAAAEIILTVLRGRRCRPL